MTTTSSSTSTPGSLRNPSRYLFHIVFAILLLLLDQQPLFTSFCVYAAHSRRRFVTRRGEGGGGGERYDRSITTFSADGRLGQVEYGMQAALRGSTIVAFQLRGQQQQHQQYSSSNGGDDDNDDGNDRGAGGDNKGGIVCVIVRNGSYGKVHRLDHHLWLVTTGLSGDSRTLANALRTTCQEFRMNYGEPATTKEIAKESGEIQHKLTRYAGARPFGCSSFIIGVDDDSNSDSSTAFISTTIPQLYQTDPGGIVEKCTYCAAGKGRDAMLKILATLVDDDDENNNGHDAASKKPSSSSSSSNKKSNKPTTTLIDYTKVVKITKQLLKEGDDNNDHVNNVDVWIIQPDKTRRGSNNVTCYHGVTFDSLNKLHDELVGRHHTNSAK